MSYGHPNVQEVVGPADAIVVQRNLLTKEVWEACDYWRGMGKLVVADLDDDYPHLCPQNPAYYFWIQDKGGLKEGTGYTPIEALTEGFRHVDGLMSPNELILQDWSHIVPGYWLPNYAQWKWYKGIKQKELNEDEVIIGWGGSVSHWDGWWFSGLREAIPTLNERYPNVTWKICGGDVRVKGFFESLAPGRWVDQQGVPPDVWPQQVATFDIGVAPLCGPGAPQAESYDNHRSWLKAVEYLLTGVPWVASEGIVYEKLDGKGGFTVPNTPQGWLDGLSRVLDDLAGYKRESKKLMRWARDNLTMEHQVDKYVEVFNRAMANRNADMGLKLPNVAHAADLFDQIDPITALNVEVNETDYLEMLADYQARSMALVKRWAGELDLERDGVDLGACLHYPVVHEFNQRIYAEVMK